MAIKGKSKSKAAKAVTRGPKPAYVPVKQPLLARRGFWIAIGAGLGLLLIAGLAWGFIAQRNEDREEALRDAMAIAIGEYRNQLEPIRTAVGEPVPPAGFVAFPELTAALVELEGDSEDAPANADQIETTAGDAVDAASSALAALEDLDEQTLIRGKGFAEEFVLYVINSKGNFVRSMRLYTEAAELTAAAAQAQGAERAALLARARGVLDVAAELMTRANSEYIEAQVKAGVFEDFNPAAGLPLPTGATGPSA